MMNCWGGSCFQDPAGGERRIIFGGGIQDVLGGEIPSRGERILGGVAVVWDIRSRESGVEKGKLSARGDQEDEVCDEVND